MICSAGLLALFLTSCRSFLTSIVLETSDFTGACFLEGNQLRLTLRTIRSFAGSESLLFLFGIAWILAGIFCLKLWELYWLAVRPFDFPSPDWMLAKLLCFSNWKPWMLWPVVGFRTGFTMGAFDFPSLAFYSAILSMVEVLCIFGAVRKERIGDLIGTISDGQVYAIPGADSGAMRRGDLIEALSLLGCLWKCICFAY